MTILNETTLQGQNNDNAFSARELLKQLASFKLQFYNIKKTLLMAKPNKKALKLNKKALQGVASAIPGLNHGILYQNMLETSNQ